MPKAANLAIPSLRALYGQSYDARMLAWRRLGAIDKVDNLRALLADAAVPLPLQDVLEVGCGTGDVLNGVARAGIGRRCVGIEIDDVRGGAEGPVPAENGVSIRTDDGERIPFPDGSFDLVYATHVLEHVVDARAFLHELRRVARGHVYVEVPCELHLLTTRRKLQASLDIGHINAFTPESFSLMLETSGLRVVAMRAFDHSWAVHRHHRSAVTAALKSAIRGALLRLSPTLATRLLCYHVGAVCVSAPKLDIA